jgi:AcrR family transcriptional regulator
MNPHPAGAFDAGAEPLTRRALAKQRTRQRLLAAARKLIGERGYDAATVRDIAAAADLSTGAVFASFSDKAELFNEVILADYAQLLEQMDAQAAGENSTRATLVKLLAAAYAFHAEERSLVQAAISYSWVRSAEAERRARGGLRAILGRLEQVLRAGVQSGELSATLDVSLIAEMLWDGYIANWRRAIFEGWGLEALEARVASQVDVLLDGYQIAA